MKEKVKVELDGEIICIIFELDKEKAIVKDIKEIMNHTIIIKLKKNKSIK